MLGSITATGAGASGAGLVTEVEGAGPVAGIEGAGPVAGVGASGAVSPDPQPARVTPPVRIVMVNVSTLQLVTVRNPKVEPAPPTVPGPAHGYEGRTAVCG